MMVVASESLAQRDEMPHWRRFRQLLGREVDGSSFAFARFAIGGILALEALSLLMPRSGGSWLSIFYTAPHVKWRVPYPGFAWLPVWDEPFLSLYVVVMGLMGLALAVGFHSRLAALVGLLIWTHVLLLEEALYNNHYYLLALLLGILCLSPASGTARLLPSREPDDAENSRIPFWPVFLLRAQLFIVYFFGGVAKLSEEYLFAAEPVATSLRDPNLLSALSRVVSTGTLHSIRDSLSQPAVAFALAYAGLVFDLAIGFLLLARRTRLAAFLLVLAFHLINPLILFRDIGWFPMLGVATTTIFLAPDWPRRVAASCKAWFTDDDVLLRTPPVAAESRADLCSNALTLAIVCAITAQCLIPLRHLLIPGNVNWTGEGERFSWRMKAATYEVGMMQVRLGHPIAKDERFHDAMEKNAHPSDRLYHAIDARDLAWAELPEFLVIHQPLYGDRIVYNSAAPRAATTPEAARRRIHRRWQSAYERVPDVRDGRRLSSAITAILDRSQREAALATYKDHVVAARRAAEYIETRDLSAAESNQLAAVIRNALLRLRFAGHADLVADEIATITPFALEGAPPPSSAWFSIIDPGLMGKSRSSIRTLDDDAWRQIAGEDSGVFADLDRFTIHEWHSLPQTFWRTDDGDSCFAVWNHHLDLHPRQTRFVQSRPYRIYRYAQHVADTWQMNFGTRPAVYIDNPVRLFPYATQPLVRPDVDLAAEQLKYMRHNYWITPLSK